MICLLFGSLVMLATRLAGGCEAQSIDISALAGPDGWEELQGLFGDQRRPEIVFELEPTNGDEDLSEEQHCEQQQDRLHLLSKVIEIIERHNPQASELEELKEFHADFKRPMDAVCGRVYEKELHHLMQQAPPTNLDLHVSFLLDYNHESWWQSIRDVSCNLGEAMGAMEIIYREKLNNGGLKVSRSDYFKLEKRKLIDECEQLTYRYGHIIEGRIRYSRGDEDEDSHSMRWVLKYRFCQTLIKQQTP